MAKENDGRSIKRIIAMEGRISNCSRCLQRRCVYRPAAGQGDLDPRIMLVFLNEGLDNNRIIEIRQLITKHFVQDKIYHTFMVRCQPKNCTHVDKLSCFKSQCYLLDREQTCRISKSSCDGITIMPEDLQIISCLHYLIEEIDILSPEIIIIFGSRTADFALKALGILDIQEVPAWYGMDGRQILTTVATCQFTGQDAETLASYIKESQQQSVLAQ